ncbi:MAG: hypothetical protein AUJ28_02450 [Parcubacteria group bacterium CG1_02_37_51]|uniref:Type II secretion system protein GspG C-terminal domain-containing protein n=2 Tax=Candidatus Komeiliibacteriota TaxID=1817908 RepID=A0A2M8DPZ2_9BACT|nr:MAG: hypothetical protein AUJ28_02450 [Parcubacteria group bacterium CG1_02_37_51]PIY94235.1 MAG: hypothetical protein COY67_02775 [Candidatus Komeilibacteria bacterium CG_4_10_14_0_8_um_filter_37_78]PJC01002.1 MAG: hypothetical protein CO073_04610 [Candidatus Komeilibacteria bacterium CG_4_9_14_0_8_um_filter_36_9]
MIPNDNLRDSEIIVNGVDAAAEIGMPSSSDSGQAINDDFYTMPTKFNQPRTKKISKSLLIIIGIIIVVGLLIAGAIYLFTANIYDQGSDLLNPNLVNPGVLDGTPNGLLNPGENNSDYLVEDQEVPKERDEQRIADIGDLRSALALYYYDKSAYPDILTDLISKYLNDIPVNPSPGGSTYLYLPQDNNQSYKLTFALEQGGQIGGLKLVAGEYQADPNMIKPILGEIDDGPETTILPIDLIGGLDSDNDTLTDIEENLYNTSSILVDTDGDGYSDAAELVNLYDPAIGGSIRLIDSDKVEQYINTTQNYSIYYPSDWTVMALTEDKTELLFNSNTTEFIQVIIIDNPLGLSAEQWYLQYNLSATKADLTEIVVNNTIGIQTREGLSTYFSLGSKVYAVIYNMGTTSQLNYEITYQMMLKSFNLITIGLADPLALRDAQRLSDINAIRLALLSYQVDQLALPTEIDDDVETYQMIGSATDSCVVASSSRTIVEQCVDLYDYLVPEYLSDFPYDALLGSTSNTGYYLNLLTDGTLILGAIHAEVEDVLEVNN